jgi:hypothetical protein
LQALRPIGDELTGGPARRGESTAQLSELLLWNRNGRLVAVTAITALLRSLTTDSGSLLYGSEATITRCG